jgi:hypothetical protein
MSRTADARVRTRGGSALPATASTGVADLVRAAPCPVSVLASFDRALYLAYDGGVLAVETLDGVHLPNGVVVAQPSVERPLAAVRAGARGTVGGGAIEIGALAVRVVRWRRARPALRAVTVVALERAVAAAAGAVSRGAAPLPASLAVPLRAVVDQLRAGRDEAAHVAARDGLLGLGPGLTPSGDDVLAGLLAGTQLLAEAVVGSDGAVVGSDGAVVGSDGAVDGWDGAALGSQAAVRGADEVRGLALAARRTGGHVARLAPDATTAISAALLDHAARGEVAAPAGHLLAALTGAEPVEPAVDRLLAVGSTSGRDLAAGLLAAAELVTATAAATTGRTP